MSKTVKNILLVFTLICAIVLIVFCIELFLINRSSDGEPGSSISNGAPGGNTNGEPGGGSPGEGSSAEEDPNAGNQPPDEPETAPPPPDGVRYELMISNTNKLILYVKDELFDYVDNETDWWYHYTGGGNAKLEIGATFVPPITSSEEHAAFLISGYADSDDLTIGGEQTVGGSAIRGYHITANKGGETYELWMHDLSDSGFDSLSIIFIINYSNDTQKNALYEVLDTLEIMQAEDS